MSRIDDLLATILQATYGRDVRGAIHDAIEECYDDVSTAKTAAESATAAANSAATAATNKGNAAETKGSTAETKGNEAKTNGDYAKNQGDYAKTQGDRVDALITNVTAAAKSASDNAVLAKNAASTAADQGTIALGKGSTAEEKGTIAETKGNAAEQKGTIAEAKGNAAEQKGEIAKEQGETARDQGVVAKEQGDYAKSQGDYALEWGGRAETAVSTVNQLSQTVTNLIGTVNSTLAPVPSAVNNAIAVTSDADKARERADAAAASASQIISNVQDVMGEAQEVTGAAERAAQSASDNARLASQQAGRAEAAADSIDDMTVTSESVGPDGEASAEISDVDGHKNIHFILKTGKTGAAFKVLGDAYETLEDLIADVSDPEIGDQYNVGTEKPYNVYRWTGTTWEDEGKIGASVESLTNEEITSLYNGETVPSSSYKYMNGPGLAFLSVNKIKSDLNNKVDKVTGKGLSTNDFTTAYKDKVDSNATQISSLSSNKVDKVTGKSLTTNDFTNTYKSKVDNALDVSLTALSEKPSTTSIYSTDYVIFRNNSATYKVSISDFLSGLIGIGSIKTASDVASASEVEEYFGLSNE